jgi:hypothetical protein
MRSVWIARLLRHQISMPGLRRFDDPIGLVSFEARVELHVCLGPAPARIPAAAVR